MNSIVAEITALDKLEKQVMAGTISTEKFLKRMAIYDQKEKRMRILIAAQILSLKDPAKRITQL
jgi:hypothetical protein